RTDLQVTASIIWYSWVMVAVSLSLVWVAPMGWVYAITAFVVGVVFIAMAYRLRGAAKREDPNINATAMRLFHWSITYLSLLFLAVAIDPFIG
ncbi:MAG: protoheme IX farnesyltransferase, partial [Actinobacteria bacterium]|nr:protoheme IX farnesyltransferase [Actinomycetota bacterium]